MNKIDKIFKYNFAYCCLIVVSAVFTFLPWRIESGYICPGVEILHLIPLFVITICFLTSSAVLYMVYYLYNSHRAVYIIAFSLGIAGTVIGTISGIFGLYYFYVSLRVQGILMIGSAAYWVWIALILLICVLLLVNLRRGTSQNIPITDL
ncbi:MAG: hypothetical protein ACTSO9_02110 [Candidatus Helarchaeota archaeon]